MVESCQVEHEQGKTYFNICVLYVNAENPLDGEIPMVGVYDAYAYVDLNPGSDPPELGNKLDERLGLSWGQGCSFRLVTGNYNWIVLARRRETFEGDPWEWQSRGNMAGTANVVPETFYCGYLKFHLSSQGQPG